MTNEFFFPLGPVIYSPSSLLGVPNGSSATQVNTHNTATQAGTTDRANYGRAGKLSFADVVITKFDTHKDRPSE